MEHHAFLSAKDSILKPIIETVPLPEITSTWDVFHDLMSCVLEQQIHYRSTKKIFQKIWDAAGLERLTPHNFPQLEDKELLPRKLSMNKYETILQLIAFFEQNNPDWQTLPDDEIRRQLVKIKGISHWTVDMILIFTLQRPDVFPADDYHLKQIMVQLYQIGPDAPLKPRMKEIAAAWSPHRSLAVRYLLAWKAFQKQKKSQVSS